MSVRSKSSKVDGARIARRREEDVQGARRWMEVLGRPRAGARRGGLERAGSEEGRVRRLLTALGACTLDTISAHARRRNWELGPVAVEMSHDDDGGRVRVARLVRLGASLDGEQHEQLIQVCDSTPVTLAIADAAWVTTEIVSTDVCSPQDASLARVEPTLSETSIDEILEHSFPASDPPSWTLGASASR